MEKINLTLADDQKELIVREGTALEQKAPEKISVTGDIKTISAFLGKRYLKGGAKNCGYQTVDKDKAIVLVDRHSMFMLLLLDPEDHYGAKVHAKLEFTPEITEFAINTSKQWTREELIRLLKFSKRFFDTPDDHDRVLTAFQKLNLSTNSTLNNESDSRGNKDFAYKKTVSSQVPTFFSINIPIFKGQPVERFGVDICIDVTESNVRFWFESTELSERIQQRRDEIFAEELKSCTDLVIVNK